MTAAWKPGFESLHKADAQLVADEIAPIGNSATAEQILDKGRDPRTELHKCFEWDDAKAAESYRIQQAGQVVRHLVIRETIEKDKTPIRFFYKAEPSEGYQPTQIIYRNPDKYQAMVDRVKRELIAIREKNRSLTEFEEVFDAIDAMAQRKVS